MVINQVAQSFDDFRNALLKAALRYGFLRKIFFNRSLRLFFLYHLATAVFLPLALFYPLVLLSFGPLISGIPHILASFYYSSRSFAGKEVWKKYFVLVSIFWILTAVYRVLTDFDFISGDYNRVEIILFFALVGAFAFIERQWSLVSLPRLALMSLFCGLLWQIPWEAVGIGLLLHNWIAFYFWGRVAQTKSDRMTVVLCAFSFLLLHSCFIPWGDHITHF